ncbi:unnamed protein product, partial [Prorocentrum cordatum]
AAVARREEEADDDEEEEEDKWPGGRGRGPMRHLLGKLFPSRAASREPEAWCVEGAPCIRLRQGFGAGEDPVVASGLCSGRQGAGRVRGPRAGRGARRPSRAGAGLGHRRRGPRAGGGPGLPCGQRQRGRGRHRGALRQARKVVVFLFVVLPLGAGGPRTPPPLTPP